MNQAVSIECIMGCKMIIYIYIYDIKEKLKPLVESTGNLAKDVNTLEQYKISKGKQKEKDLNVNTYLLIKLIS